MPVATSPRPQVAFHRDLKVINECLDDLISRAKASRQEEDFEALQRRDYSQVREGDGGLGLVGSTVVVAKDRLVVCRQ